MADPGLVGFDAGWKIELRAADAGAPTDDGMIEISRSQYFGTVKVHRTSAFVAPTFDVVIEGLSDDTHNTIVGAPFVFVKILLGWRDLGSGAAAPFQDIGAVFSGSDGDDANYVEVIHGRLETYERLHGSFRYRTHMAGIDHRFRALRCTPATKLDVKPGDPARRYAELLAQQASVPLMLHPPDGPGEPIDEVIELEEGDTVAKALEKVARRAHGGGERAAIPMYVGVDGLHFGPWTSPETGDALTAKRLEMSTGLVESRPDVAPAPDACGDPFAVPTELGFDLVLRGRPDLAVADKVEIEAEVPTPGSLPPTVADSVLGGIGDVAAGIAGMFGASPTPTFDAFRVVSVRHEIDRARGFVTNVRVERQPEGAPATDTEPQAKSRTRTADEASRAALALQAAARAERRETALLDVGVVAAQSVDVGEVEGRAFDPQRVEIHAGLVREAHPNATVNAEPVDVPTTLFNKPYLTPFAFGATGLVVPHYPGTRVVDLNFRENIANAVVAGCIWPAGDEPVSELGDWWLSLPTEVEVLDRAAEPAEAAPPSGPASHDLIDAHGGRAVHVRGLHIGVGDSELVAVGTRPDSAPVDEITIRHKSGAEIHIDPDGNITISTPADLRFEANKITLAVADSAEVVQQ